MTPELAILLVEDDDDDFVIARNLLAKIDLWPHKLERASSFDAGLAAVERRAHDIYFVDYRLGARSGLDLIRQSTASGATRPFVILTGQGDDTIDRDATSAGASDYIEKDGLTARLLERTIRNSLERSRIVTELASRARQQAAVAHLGQVALSGMELDRVFDEALADLARVLTVDLTQLCQLLPDRSAFSFRAGLGWKDDSGGATVVPLDSQMGHALAHHEPVIVDDFVTETRFAIPPYFIDHGVVSGMTVLVGPTQRPWGVLGVHARSPRKFSADEVSFLQAIADVLATAISRKQTEDELRESRHLLEQAQEVGGIGTLDGERRDRRGAEPPGARSLVGPGLQDPRPLERYTRHGGHLPLARPSRRSRERQQCGRASGGRSHALRYRAQDRPRRWPMSVGPRARRTSSGKGRHPKRS